MPKQYFDIIKVGEDAYIVKPIKANPTTMKKIVIE